MIHKCWRTGCQRKGNLEPIEGGQMDSPNPLVLFSAQCLLWGMFASVREMQLGIHLMQGSSIGFHTKQDLKSSRKSQVSKCGDKGGVYKALTIILHDGDATMETFSYYSCSPRVVGATHARSQGALNDPRTRWR